MTRTTPRIPIAQAAIPAECLEKNRSSRLSIGRMAWSATRRSTSSTKAGNTITTQYYTTHPAEAGSPGPYAPTSAIPAR